MKKILKNLTQPIIYMALGLLLACNSGDPNPGKTANQIDTASQKNSTTAEATAYKLDTNTGWGYKIVVNNKQYINQKQIPFIQGIKPFATQEDAQKTGDWVAGQIRKGEPFGISDSILKKLEIKY